MRHLLCPVPAVHIVAAQDAFATHQRVAFGSNQYELLNGLNGEPAAVWIAASTGYVPTGGVPDVNIGKVVLRGRFTRAVWCDKRGRHPDPTIRPITTTSDGTWAMFYEVADLRPVEPAIPTAGLRGEKGGRVEVAPHMIVPIRDPSDP